MVLIYLVPKNIRVKREIFKGFGLLEIFCLFVSGIIGYFMTLLVTSFNLKVFLFCIFPFITFILLLPLPNGGRPLTIVIRFVKFQHNQKQYKLKI